MPARPTADVLASSERATPTDPDAARRRPESARLIQAPHGPTAAIMAMAVGGFAIGTTEFASMGLLPEISRSLQITESHTGNLISAYAVGVVIGGPVLAGLGARLPRRLTLLGLMGLLVIGHIASVLAPNYPSLLAARFFSGLPHGAYFGIASLMAASLVPAERRGRAVAGMMLGLTVANVVGVPLTTAIGQIWGWRAAYALVAGIGLLTLILVRIFVPSVAAATRSTIRRELGALRNPRVLFTLAVGAIGFGGMFAVYTYIAPTMTTLAGLAESTIPWVLATFGLGMTIGTLTGGRISDRNVTAGITSGFIATAVTMAAFPFTLSVPVLAFVNVFFMGFSSSLMLPSLQVRLMNVAGNAQSLAASMNHSALNLANAGGAWLGGVVIAAGWGYTGPAKVAVVLSITGLIVFGASTLVGRSGPGHRVPALRPN